MVDDYYPKYYLKKRKRDALFSSITYGFVIAVLVVGGCFAGYLAWVHWIKPIVSKGTTARDLAEERDELQARELIQDAQPREEEGLSEQERTEIAQNTDLGSIEYSASFPQVHVALEGAGGDDGVSRDPHTIPEDDATTVAPPADEAGTAETPPQQPAEGKPSGDAGGGGSGSTQGGSGGSEDSQAAAPPGPSSAPAGSGTESASGQDNAPPEQPEQQAQANAANTGSSDDSAGRYRVYAGYEYSREAAESLKKDLDVLGLTAKIIQSGAEYNVLVGVFDDYDAATALRDKLKESGFGNAFATKKGS